MTILERKEKGREERKLKGEKLEVVEVELKGDA